MSSDGSEDASRIISITPSSGASRRIGGVTSLDIDEGACRSGGVTSSNLGGSVMSSDGSGDASRINSMTSSGGASRIIGGVTSTHIDGDENRSVRATFLAIDGGASKSVDVAYSDLGGCGVMSSDGCGNASIINRMTSSGDANARIGGVTSTNTFAVATRSYSATSSHVGGLTTTDGGGTLKTTGGVGGGNVLLTDVGGSICGQAGEGQNNTVLKTGVSPLSQQQGGDAQPTHFPFPSSNTLHTEGEPRNWQHDFNFDHMYFAYSSPTKGSESVVTDSRHLPMSSPKFHRGPEHAMMEDVQQGYNFNSRYIPYCSPPVQKGLHPTDRQRQGGVGDFEPRNLPYSSPPGFPTCVTADRPRYLDHQSGYLRYLTPPIALSCEDMPTDVSRYSLGLDEVKGAFSADYRTPPRTNAHGIFATPPTRVYGATVYQATDMAPGMYRGECTPPTVYHASYTTPLKDYKAKGTPPGTHRMENTPPSKVYKAVNTPPLGYRAVNVSPERFGKVGTTPVYMANCTPPRAYGQVHTPSKVYKAGNGPHEAFRAADVSPGRVYGSEFMPSSVFKGASMPSKVHRVAGMPLETHRAVGTPPKTYRPESMPPTMYRAYGTPPKMYAPEGPHHGLYGPLPGTPPEKYQYVYNERHVELPEEYQVYKERNAASFPDKCETSFRPYAAFEASATHSSRYSPRLYRQLGTPQKTCNVAVTPTKVSKIVCGTPPNTKGVATVMTSKVGEMMFTPPPGMDVNRVLGSPCQFYGTPGIVYGTPPKQCGMEDTHRNRHRAPLTPRKSEAAVTGRFVGKDNADIVKEPRESGSDPCMAGLINVPTLWLKTPECEHEQIEVPKTDGVIDTNRLNRLEQEPRTIPKSDDVIVIDALQTDRGANSGNVQPLKRKLSEVDCDAESTCIISTDQQKKTVVVTTASKSLLPPPTKQSTSDLEMIPDFRPTTTPVYATDHETEKEALPTTSGAQSNVGQGSQNNLDNDQKVTTSQNCSLSIQGGRGETTTREYMCPVVRPDQKVTKTVIVIPHTTQSDAVKRHYFYPADKTSRTVVVRPNNATQCEPKRRYVYPSATATSTDQKRTTKRVILIPTTTAHSEAKRHYVYPDTGRKQKATKTVTMTNKVEEEKETGEVVVVRSTSPHGEVRRHYVYPNFNDQDKSAKTVVVIPSTSWTPVDNASQDVVVIPNMSQTPVENAVQDVVVIPSESHTPVDNSVQDFPSFISQPRTNDANVEKVPASSVIASDMERMNVNEPFCSGQHMNANEPFCSGKQMNANEPFYSGQQPTRLPKLYCCGVCDAEFDSVADLRPHAMKRHSVRLVRCGACNKVFQHCCKLALHTASHVKKYAANYRSKGISYSSSLSGERAIASLHENVNRSKTIHQYPKPAELSSQHVENVKNVLKHLIQAKGKESVNYMLKHRTQAKVSPLKGREYAGYMPKQQTSYRGRGGVSKRTSWQTQKTNTMVKYCPAKSISLTGKYDGLENIAISNAVQESTEDSSLFTDTRRKAEQDKEDEDDTDDRYPVYCDLKKCSPHKLLSLQTVEELNFRNGLESLSSGLESLSNGLESLTSFTQAFESLSLPARIAKGYPPLLDSFNPERYRDDVENAFSTREEEYVYSSVFGLDSQNAFTTEEESPWNSSAFCLTSQQAREELNLTDGFRPVGLAIWSDHTEEMPQSVGDVSTDSEESNQQWRTALDQRQILTFNTPSPWNKEFVHDKRNKRLSPGAKKRTAEVKKRKPPTPRKARTSLSHEYQQPSRFKLDTTCGSVGNVYSPTTHQGMCVGNAYSCDEAEKKKKRRMSGGVDSFAEKEAKRGHTSSVDFLREQEKKKRILFKASARSDRIFDEVVVSDTEKKKNKKKKKKERADTSDDEDITDTTKRKTFCCGSCSEDFDHVSKLREHVFLYHTVDRTVMCGHCGIVFQYCSQLITHVKIHTQEQSNCRRTLTPQKQSRCNAKPVSHEQKDQRRDTNTLVDEKQSGRDDATAETHTPKKTKQSEHDVTAHKGKKPSGYDVTLLADCKTEQIGPGYVSSPLKQDHTQDEQPACQVTPKKQEEMHPRYQATPERKAMMRRVIDNLREKRQKRHAQRLLETELLQRAENNKVEDKQHKGAENDKMQERHQEAAEANGEKYQDFELKPDQVKSADIDNPADISNDKNIDIHIVASAANVVSDDKSDMSNRKIAEKSCQCMLCPATFVSKLSLAIHMRVHKKTGMMNSPASVKRAVKLKKQAVKIQGGKRVFKCDYCSKIFGSWCEMKGHRQSHLVKKSKSRGQSETKGRRQDEMKYHRQLFTPLVKVKGHRRQSHLVKRNGHCQSHLAEHVVCDECGVRFKELRYLRTHRKRIHNDAKPSSVTTSQVKHSAVKKPLAMKNRATVCEECGVILKEPRYLRRHMQRVHNLPPTHTPSPCPEVNSQLKSVDIPRVNSSPSPVNCKLEVCEDCGLMYKDMRRHKKRCSHFADKLAKVKTSTVQRVQTLVKHSVCRISCEDCGIKFNARSLRRHRQRFHSAGKVPKVKPSAFKSSLAKKTFPTLKTSTDIKSSPAPAKKKSPATKSSTAKKLKLSPAFPAKPCQVKPSAYKSPPCQISGPVVCEDCGAKFKHARDLIEHRHKVHTVETPNECLGKYTSAASMKGHKLVHSGEKPFPCDECPGRYSTASNLKRHKVAHSGETPFQCTLCENAYTSSSSLKKHAFTKHGIF